MKKILFIISCISLTFCSPPEYTKPRLVYFEPCKYYGSALILTDTIGKNVYTYGSSMNLFCNLSTNYNKNDIIFQWICPNNDTVKIEGDEYLKIKNVSYLNSGKYKCNVLYSNCKVSTDSIYIYVK